MIIYDHGKGYHVKPRCKVIYLLKVCRPVFLDHGKMMLKKEQSPKGAEIMKIIRTKSVPCSRS